MPVTCSLCLFVPLNQGVREIVESAYLRSGQKPSNPQLPTDSVRSVPPGWTDEVSSPGIITGCDVAPTWAVSRVARYAGHAFESASGLSSAEKHAPPTPSGPQTCFPGIYLAEVVVIGSTILGIVRANASVCAVVARIHYSTSSSVTETDLYVDIAIPGPMTVRQAPFRIPGQSHPRLVPGTDYYLAVKAHDDSPESRCLGFPIKVTIPSTDGLCC